MKTHIKKELEESHKFLTQHSYEDLQGWELEGDDLHIYEFGRIQGLEYALSLLENEKFELIKSDNIEIIKQPKYKENLTMVLTNSTRRNHGNYLKGFVFSYSTKVGEIKGDKLITLGYWSPTTSKHLNYVARYLNLKLINNE